MLSNKMLPKKVKASAERLAPLWIVLGVLSLAAVFSLGFLVGRGQPGVVTLQDGSVVGIGEAKRISADVEFDLFWQVWNMLQNEYLRGPVSDKDLFYSAMEGLVNGVGDPYSVFFDPREANDFQSDLAGKFEGIGAEIGIRDDQLVIISPLENSPAKRAGIQAGDRVYLIDDKSTDGMTVEEAVRNIRGPKGSTVVLTVTHDGIAEVEEVPIVRDVIEISSVEWDIDDNGIATIDIHFFNEDTARQFNRASVELLSRGVEGIVLDMRNNPGGFLDRAVSVIGEWVGNDVAVVERNDAGETAPYHAQGIARLRDIPTVVLVNGGSASATEIVAGALQDYGLATLVGTQTFGKGSVQEYRALADGSGVKITVAEWLTPKLRSIDQVGIEPDEIVEITEVQYLNNEDPQMARAIEILNEQR